MLFEAVDALNVRADGVYVDGTFGRGGHSRLILTRLGPAGRLIALDRDPDAVAAAKEMTDARFTMVHAWFAELSEVLASLDVKQVDGVLLDLGISSPQIDNPERGFSFRFEGPLDMRMDTTRGMTAAEWLAEVDERTLREVIRDYGEERFAKQVARAIIAAREGTPVTTTKQLAEIVAKAVPTREFGQDPATRTFQAIRIFLNQELKELSVVLNQCVDVLAPHGRLAIISFHSLEDRIVKRFMRDEAKGSALPEKLPLRHDQLPQPRLKLIGKAVRPSVEEMEKNPRARSAVMRVAERTEAMA